MADKDISLELNDSAEDAKQADRSKKGTGGAHPPVLIEFTVMLSAILLVGVFFTIVGILFLNGSSLLDFVIRTSISILVLGSLLVIITRQIVSGMYSAEKEKPSSKADELDMQSPAEVN